MKLLVAIKSKDYSAIRKSLRWVARSGYDIRIFIKAKEWETYNDTLSAIGQDHYIVFPKETLVTDNITPETYAQQNGYDLLLVVPEHKPSFTGKRKRINLEAELYAFVEAAGTARKEMSEDQEIVSIKLKPSVTIKRVLHNEKEASTS